VLLLDEPFPQLDAPRVALPVALGQEASFPQRPANRSDTEEFVTVLDEINVRTGESLSADKGFRSQLHRYVLHVRGLPEGIMRKAARNRELMLAEKAANRQVSRVRAKVERAFGTRKRGHGFFRAGYLGFGETLGYRIEVGGATEESEKANHSIVVLLPMAAGIMILLLMFQLQSFKGLFLVLATAPLSLIGAVGALLAFGQPFGFVAMLGVLSLAGMIMRNSVILVDQIAQDIAAGLSAWEAVIEATIRRTRPVVLTAMAAMLAMVPLSRNMFWGPMAVAIMGGLLIATILTLLFTPALYAMIFQIERNEKQDV